MQFELVGHRLAYKRKDDHEISIRPISEVDKEGEKKIKITEGKQDKQPEITIDLRNMLTGAAGLSSVNFLAVPKNSFASLKFLDASGNE